MNEWVERHLLDSYRRDASGQPPYTSSLLRPSIRTRAHRLSSRGETSQTRARFAPVDVSPGRFRLAVACRRKRPSTISVISGQLSVDISEKLGNFLEKYFLQIINFRLEV